MFYCLWDLITYKSKTCKHKKGGNTGNANNFGADVPGTSQIVDNRRVKGANYVHHANIAGF